MTGRRNRVDRRWPLLSAAILLLAACGSGSSPGDGSPTAPPSPTARPATFEEALLAHLTDGLGDAPLAKALLERLGPDTLGALDRATGGNVAHPLLALHPPTVDVEQIDTIVVFAFGNRVDVEGDTTPGPMNEALAEATAAFVAEHPRPVYAQWEVAERLAARGLSDVVSIGTTVDEAGNVVYLSTAGVAQQVVEHSQATGLDLGQVGVIAFSDHAVRSVFTARAAGMTAAAPRGLVLPSVYDEESGQPWTRDRLSYLSIDLPARLLFADGSAPTSVARGPAEPPR